MSKHSYSKTSILRQCGYLIRGPIDYICDKLEYMVESLDVLPCRLGYHTYRFGLRGRCHYCYQVNDEK
jgi:hypothetical protein